MWFHMPFYWALVPASDYDAAKRFLFPDHSALAQHARLLEKTDYYNNIKKNCTAILEDAAADIKVGINCGYGFPLSSYSKDAYNTSDELVDTYYASIGATCAEVNRPFSRFFYKQADTSSGINYISPDRYIDASTCLFPTRTWFNKDAPHVPDIRVDGWVDWFANAPKGKDTIRDNPNYPQWMKYVDFGKYAPLNFSETLWDILFGLFMSAVVSLGKIWRFLFLLPLFWL